MNPKEFSWNEDQRITVTNPTAAPYKFKVHNKDYELGAGQTAEMPGYIAWVYVYGLATQLAQADGVFNRWNEEGFRQEYYEKLIAGVNNVVQEIEVQPAPEITVLDDDAEEYEGLDEKQKAIRHAELHGGSTYTPDPEVKPMTAQPKAKALRRGKS